METKPIRTAERGGRKVIIAINSAGTVYHTMIERGLNRAYVYRDLSESELAVEKWLTEGLALNPSEVIPYYG